MNATAKELPRGPERGRIRRTDARALDEGPPAARGRSRRSTSNAACASSCPIGEGAIAANLVIGEVLLIHIDEAVLDPSGRVDPRKLRTIARLGGNFYCRSTDLFEMERP